MRTVAIRSQPRAADVLAGRIVVGVDGAAGGWYALAWAADEAATTGAALTICRAGRTVPGGRTMAAVELADPPLARAIHRVRDRLGGQRVAVRIEPGPAVSLLSDATATADLVVLGPPGPSGTARRLASTVDCPVVLVRAATGTPTGPFAGHVVVAIGGGGIDLLTLAFGFRYAAEHHLPLAAVHVAASAPADFWFDEQTLATHLIDPQTGLGPLAAVVEPLRPRYPQVEVKLCVLVGDPVTRLRQIARDARLMVVGRRRQRPDLTKLGATCAGLVDTADTTVAVVPPTWWRM